MRVLIVGGGGREHALAWRLRQDDPAVELYAAPGNPGIAELATCVPISSTDLSSLEAFAREHAIALTVVGPEAPLADGIVDRFRGAGLSIFGPTASAARIETSKAFSKDLMRDAGVPTARAETCTTLASALAAVDRFGVPLVIKASGLAAGKGVIVCTTETEARAAIASMLEERAFGDAGRTVLVEEFMEGEELSLFAITDGEGLVPLVAAQDHKRLLPGDEGPNTGGMGAYAPVSLVEHSPELLDDVIERIMLPTLAGLRTRGAPFTGLLYAGLMLTEAGPKVVEFNCRFGDPETEAVLPCMTSSTSLLELMAIVARGDALPSNVRVEAARHAVTTVVAAGGYPERPRTGDSIILPTPDANVLVFHAGTTRSPDGTLVTAGGRVLAITGLGDSFEEAQRRSQDQARAVAFAGKQFRDDIGWRELARRAGAS